MNTYTTQNGLLLKNLLDYYKEEDNLDKMLNIINGESKISLRIVDWFTTNYAKKYYTVYQLPGSNKRFKVYVDYKLKLKFQELNIFQFPLCLLKYFELRTQKKNLICKNTRFSLKTKLN